MGGNSFAYYDTDDTNEGGEYRQDGVDVVKLGSGYAVGYPLQTNGWNIP